MWQSALVHPIERLRYVARSGGIDQFALAREAADALGSLWGEPAELVNACRRILHHHPLAGSLWAMASKVLIATDARRAAIGFVEELNSDDTPRSVASALPNNATVAVIGWPDLAMESIHLRRDIKVRVIDAYGEGAALARTLLQREVDVVEVPLTGLGQACATADIVILEAAAAGPEALIAPSGSYAAAICGLREGKDTWAVIGVGRALPRPFFEVIEDQLAKENVLEADEEVVPLEVFTHIIGPEGKTPSTIPMREDCAVAAELLRPSL